jgi:hypothetical protein
MKTTVGNRWYRSLHAQPAQAVMEKLWQSYKSWFEVRKKGDTGARPPSFRRGISLSTVTFIKDSVFWDPDLQTLRIGRPGAGYKKKCVNLSLVLQPGLVIPASAVQMARLVEHARPMTRPSSRRSK